MRRFVGRLEKHASRSAAARRTAWGKRLSARREQPSALLALLLMTDAAVRDRLTASSAIRETDYPPSRRAQSRYCNVPRHTHASPDLYGEPSRPAQLYVASHLVSVVASAAALCRRSCRVTGTLDRSSPDTGERLPPVLKLSSPSSAGASDAVEIRASIRVDYVHACSRTCAPQATSTRAPNPRRRSEPSVPRKKGRAEGFGQGDIGGVVGG